jgi:hypothetical protein
MKLKITAALNFKEVVKSAAYKKLISMAEQVAKSKGLKDAGNNHGGEKTEQFGKWKELSVYLWVSSGIRYDHSVPLKDREDGRSAPAYLGVSVSVGTSGESTYMTEDGPMDKDKSYFNWSKKFPLDVTPEEVESVKSELSSQIDLALTEFGKVAANCKAMKEKEAQESRV